MKKVIMFSLLVLSLSWCSNSLQTKIDNLEDYNFRLKQIISDCNDNIQEAKEYIWGEYEDMEYALDTLEECSVY